MSVTFILPFPPSTNGLYPGKSRRYKSEAYVAWELAAWAELKRQRIKPVSGLVVVRYELQYPVTKRRMDAGNREKCLTDFLVSQKIIEGDDQFCVWEINIGWSADPAVIGCRVTITPHSQILFGKGEAA